MTQVRRYPKCKRHFVNYGESVTVQHSTKSRKDRWDKAQVVIAALIPIAIGVGSYWIQESISKESVAKDYVGIATTILERPKQEGDNDLREWARKLLVRYSPEPFSPKAQEQLESGGISVGQGITHPNALSASPNGKKLVMTTTLGMGAAGSLPGSLRGSGMFRHALVGLIAEVYDLQTGKMISQFEAGPDSVQRPTLVWSPDSSKLLIGWSIIGDFFASLFEVAEGKRLGFYSIKGGGEIQSAEFSEDGRSVNIKTADGKTEVWQQGVSDAPLHGEQVAKTLR